MAKQYLIKIYSKLDSRYPSPEWNTYAPRTWAHAKNNLEKMRSLVKDFSKDGNKYAVFVEKPEGTAYEDGVKIKFEEQYYLGDLSGYKPKTHIGKQTAAVRDEWKRIARAALREDPKNGLKKASKIYAAIRKEKGIKLKKKTC